MGRVMREVLITVTIAGAVGGAAYLIRANRALTHENQLLARRAVDPRPGLFVPAYPAVTLNDAPMVLGKRHERQLIVFFNHLCPYCRASVPAWTALDDALRSHGGPKVVGVALDSVHIAQQYVKSTGIAFDVVAERDPRLVGLYRISAVPLVMLVDDGRINYARIGVLDSPTAMDSVLTAARQAEGSAQ